MVNILIDGTLVDVPAEYTLLQAAEAAGAEIPRFCYHERLSIAGNCRMCLVELVGAPKPVASCAYAVKDCRPGPNGEPPAVNTGTPMVRKAREGVMEFLLINHPLDCPICDQGGECDLQDQAMAYGVDSSRFAENKRAVEDKYIGALVKTSMNRCIHCTRCVRFTTEVAGVGDLGATGRGEDMEITTYLEGAMASELQSNVVDLCPVGALTSKPYSFNARPWELLKTETVDVMDGLGSAIRIDVRGREVMRILPRLNEAVNEEWISDKTRHIVDGLKAQRLDRPYVRQNGRLQAVSWAEAFRVVAEKINVTPANRIGMLVGDLASVEDMYALKRLAASLGVNAIDARTDGSVLHPSYGRASYTLGSTIAGVEDANALLLIGCNPRLEAPVFNARLRKRWLQGGFPVASIGVPVDLTYPVMQLGAGVSTLTDLLNGAHSFSLQLSDAKRPLILLGQGALNRADSSLVIGLAAQLGQKVGVVTPDWNGFGVLHTAASRVGALDLGLVPSNNALDARAMVKSGAVDVLFNLGADEIDIEPGAFVIYQGTHGDRGAQRADVIFPSAAYTEKDGTYVNTEGRVQRGYRAAFPVGEAREDWAILRALSAMLGKPLPFDSLSQLRAHLYNEYPHFADAQTIAASDPARSLTMLASLATQKATAQNTPLQTPIRDFYLTNPIARASKVMAECSALARGMHKVAAE
jgi:NADH-quinone oxidoreductase subunit G